MMRALKMSGCTSLLRQTKYGFCLHGFALLDPRKHNTMNHNISNMYLDVYEFGQYPDIIELHSIAPRTYEAQILEIVSASLSERTVTLTSPRALRSLLAC